MWCTRWYLPLVLLPWPVAPPYFLLLFIFSTTLHAKPCFYCIVLLSAVFMSSCYWPPVPLDSALTKPWSENITTFSDALLSVLPDLTAQERPDTIQMVDRCWCDFSSSGGFFKSYNVTQWETNSVMRFKEGLEKKRVVRAQKQAAADVARSANATSSDRAMGPPVDPVNDSQPPTAWSIWDVVRRFSHPPGFATMTPSPTSSRLDHVPSIDSSPSTYSTPAAATPQSIFRKEYDLRPYGFGITLDFGWSTPMN